jgi:cytoskeletal protein RodZ
LSGFGEKLRKQREQRDISLEAISSSTKISMRMLRALEEEHFDQLPGGVFNKGFVRAYARHVGLDEEETIAEYLDALRESQMQNQSIMPDLRSGARQSPSISADSNRERAAHTTNGNRSSTATTEIDLDIEPALETVGSRAEGRLDRRSSIGTPSRSIPWLTLALALALVIVGVALWNFSRRHEGAANLHTRTAPQQSASASSTSQLVRPRDSATSPLASQPSPASSAGASHKTVTEAPNKIQRNSSDASNSAANTSVTQPASKPTSPAAAPADSVTPPPKQDESLAPPATFTLHIRAEKTTWVSIVADGKQVAQEFLIAPAHTSVRASNEITVKAGNAAGIIFELNGKQVGEPGADGEVKTYVFDANGIQPSVPPNR